MVHIDYSREIDYKWSGHLNLVKIDKWYEPIIYYPFQFFIGIIHLIPYLGFKWLITDVYKIDEKRIKIKNKHVPAKENNTRIRGKK